MVVEPALIETRLITGDELITMGDTQTYTVQGYDSSDNSVGEVTSDCTFSIDTEAGGSWLDNVYTSENAGTWTVTANHTGGGGTDTATLTVNPGGAAKLAFGQQPTDTEAGSVITPAVTVRILDANDNLVISATNMVAIAISNNPGSGTLSGTLAKAAVDGIATFDDLSINKAGTGYTLTASSTGLAGDTSSAFSITAGAISYIVVSPETSTVTAGDKKTYNFPGDDNRDKKVGERKNKNLKTNQNTKT